MDNESAFKHAIGPKLEILLHGREETFLTLPRNAALNERIEVLAEKSTEGELTDEERDEYKGDVQANAFLAVLLGAARRRMAGGAS